MEEIKTTAPEVEDMTDAKATATETRTDKKKMKKLESELSALQKKVEELEAAKNESEDKYLRMMAEYDNFRKRSAKEKEGVWADAYADCVANILPILDNLDRASHSENFEAVKKGLEMTEKAFLDAMVGCICSALTRRRGYRPRSRYKHNLGIAYSHSVAEVEAAVVVIACK